MIFLLFHVTVCACVAPAFRRQINDGTNYSLVGTRFQQEKKAHATLAAELGNKVNQEDGGVASPEAGPEMWEKIRTHS